MKARWPLKYGIAAGAALLLFSGCATDVVNSRVLVPVPNATINGQPLKVTLDTGAGYAAFLTETAVQRLGIRSTPTTRQAATAPATGLTDAVHLTMGAENFTAQFAIFDWDGFDLLIGWPAIRDNILVFDGASHTVTAVMELPDVTAGWIKLKIKPVAQARVLILEMPFGDGVTGTVMIDTGDPGGVTLPEAQWKLWREAHPGAQLNLVAETVGSTGVAHTVPVADADEIKLGPLTLTNVPLRETGDVTVYGDAGNNFAGSLGLGALARMDLVVDNKNGVAYLRTKPAPVGGSTSPKNDGGVSATRQNWTVAGAVRLNGDAFVLAAVEYRINAEDYDGALADCSHVLELDPRNVDAWILRATARQDRRDFDGAMADCDQALKLDPQNEEAALLRAVALESKGDQTSTEALVSPAAPAGSAPGLLDAISIANRLGREMNGGDFDAVIGDVTALITYQPTDSSGLYLMRGAAWQGKGDDARALADFNHEIQLDPHNASAYVWRGMAWQSRGDFAHALADWDRSIELQKDFTPRLLDRILLARNFLLRRLNRPTADFAASVAEWKDNWEKTLGQFAAGKLDEAALLAAAENPGDSPVPVRQAEADYCIGMKLLLDGDAARARTFFQKCANGDPKMLEFTSRIARAELGRLDAANRK